MSLVDLLGHSKHNRTYIRTQSRHRSTSINLICWHSGIDLYICTSHYLTCPSAGGSLYDQGRKEVSLRLSLSRAVSFKQSLSGGSRGWTEGQITCENITTTAHARSHDKRASSLKHKKTRGFSEVKVWFTKAMEQQSWLPGGLHAITSFHYMPYLF